MTDGKSKWWASNGTKRKRGRATERKSVLRRICLVGAEISDLVVQLDAPSLKSFDGLVALAEVDG